MSIDYGYGLWLLVALDSLLVIVFAVIVGGFWLVAGALRVLFSAQQAGVLATSGPYQRIRHPQYTGLLLIMVGFLIQWPTIPTLLMFLVLAITYRRLAIREEREVRDQFTGAWDDYASQTPRFIPVRRGRRCGEQADAPDTLRTSASLARGDASRPVAEG